MPDLHGQGRGHAWTVIADGSTIRSSRDDDSWDDLFVVHDDDRCRYNAAKRTAALAAREEPQGPADLDRLFESIKNLQGYRTPSQASFLAHVDSIRSQVIACLAAREEPLFDTPKLEEQPSGRIVPAVGGEDTERPGEVEQLREGLERACDVSFTVGLLRLRAEKDNDAELAEWGERLKDQLVAIREVLSPGTAEAMAEMRDTEQEHER